MIGDCDCPGPNYGHLHRDPESGLLFIVEVGTKRRLYRHPNCDLCGIANYSYSSAARSACGSECTGRRKEANSNVHPADQQAGGVFVP